VKDQVSQENPSKVENIRNTSRERTPLTLIKDNSTYSCPKSKFLKGKVNGNE
jgi:hypothetical protein